jgi:peroxidase
VVQGCDASILIKSTARNMAEMDVAPNRLTLHGMDLIDTAKDAVEKACPGIVSCADILALATRDSVVLVSTRTHSLLSLHNPSSFYCRSSS